jgi:hypothetical protein
MVHSGTGAQPIAATGAMLAVCSGPRPMAGMAQG